MNNQVIIITGASNGFGRMTAETLAQHGHTVYATVRDMTGKTSRPRVNFSRRHRRDRPASM